MNTSKLKYLEDVSKIHKLQLVFGFNKWVVKAFMLSLALVGVLNSGAAQAQQTNCSQRVSNGKILSYEVFEVATNRIFRGSLRINQVYGCRLGNCFSGLYGDGTSIAGSFSGSEFNMTRVIANGAAQQYTGFCEVNGITGQYTNYDTPQNLGGTFVLR